MAPYGLFEVLAVAGGHGARDGTPVLAPKIVARTAQPFATAIGLPLTPHCALNDTGNAELIIVCDAEIAPGQSPKGRWPEEVAWLKQRFQDGAVVCSTCSGALVLAEAGLLDGQDSTSHWATAALFRDHYPSVRFRPEQILCTSAHGGRLITSGGASSWQELALYLIARYCGAVEAARIARLFVIGERGSGQLPFAAMAVPRQHDDRVVATVQAWIANNYGISDPVSAMTQQSGLHPRTFKRRFKTATGYTPIDYVLALRVEEAKQLLETTDWPLELIADAVGYSDPAHFNRLFRRITDSTPGNWRRRFSAVGVPRAR